MRNPQTPNIKPHQVYRLRVQRGGSDRAFPVLVTQVQGGFCQTLGVPAYGEMNPEATETVPLHAPQIKWELMPAKDWPRCFKLLEARRRLAAGGRTPVGDGVAFAA